MKKYIFLLFCFTAALTHAQVIVEQIKSGILEESRNIKISIPKNYTEEKVYPLILVLDADYLFDAVVANVNYYSFWEEMPEAIIVGVDQSGLRAADMEYDFESGLPKNKGEYFFDFIGIEVIPFVESKYTIANFRLAVGHDLSANYINYYLFRDPPLFSAYICLSPNFAPKMEEKIASRLAGFKDKKFYYIATAENDDRENHTRIKELTATLEKVKNQQLYFYSDDFGNANHNSLAVYAIPNALNKIFSIFKPITPKEYKEKILTSDQPVINYLYDKYNTIESLFGFKKEILINDYMAIYAACNKKKDTESLEKLAKLAARDYPKTMMSDYLMGEYYELTGKPKQALKSFQDAFAKEEIDFMTKDLAYEKMQQIKTDFGL